MKESGSNFTDIKDTARAARYGVAGVVAVYSGFMDIARRGHMVSTEFFPNKTIYSGFKDNLVQYGQEKAALIDLLIMAGGVAAIIASGVISESPVSSHKISPLDGKEFPDDMYDVERTSNS